MSSDNCEGPFQLLTGLAEACVAAALQVPNPGTFTIRRYITSEGAAEERAMGTGVAGGFITSVVTPRVPAMPKTRGAITGAKRLYSGELSDVAHGDCSKELWFWAPNPCPFKKYYLIKWIAVTLVNNMI